MDGKWVMPGYGAGGEDIEAALLAKGGEEKQKDRVKNLMLRKIFIVAFLAKCSMALFYMGIYVSFYLASQIAMICSDLQFLSLFFVGGFVTIMVGFLVFFINRLLADMTQNPDQKRLSQSIYAISFLWSQSLIYFQIAIFLSTKNIWIGVAAFAFFAFLIDWLALHCIRFLFHSSS